MQAADGGKGRRRRKRKKVQESVEKCRKLQYKGISGKDTPTKGSKKYRDEDQMRPEPFGKNE